MLAIPGGERRCVYAHSDVIFSHCLQSSCGFVGSHTRSDCAPLKLDLTLPKEASFQFPDEDELRELAIKTLELPADKVEAFVEAVTALATTLDKFLRSFAASARGSCKNVRSRHSSKPATEFHSALPHSCKEPKIVIYFNASMTIGRSSSGLVMIASYPPRLISLNFQPERLHFINKAIAAMDRTVSADDRNFMSFGRSFIHSGTEVWSLLSYPNG